MLVPGGELPGAGKKLGVGKTGPIIKADQQPRLHDRIVRRERQRLFIGRRRFVQPALILKRDGKIAVGLGGGADRRSARS